MRKLFQHLVQSVVAYSANTGAESVGAANRSETSVSIRRLCFFTCCYSVLLCVQLTREQWFDRQNEISTDDKNHQCLRGSPISHEYFRVQFKFELRNESSLNMVFQVHKGWPVLMVHLISWSCYWFWNLDLHQPAFWVWSRCWIFHVLAVSQVLLGLYHHTFLDILQHMLGFDLH